MARSSLRDPSEAGQRLDPEEKFWRDHFNWLLQCGYKLRPRFQPDWKPSWKTTGKLFLLCEDSVALTNGQIIDATRTEDGSLVALKRISKSEDPFEEDISKFFSSKSLIDNSQNHCIRLLGVLQPPEDDDASILVLPFLRRFDNPPFDTFGEVIECFRQLFEGIQFMHRHHVAHRDINANNFMMDFNSICPDGFHPSMISQKKDLSGPAVFFSRTQKPPKYYLIDFGISRSYDPTNSSPLEPPIAGGDRTVPEFQNSSEPRNPFPTDIYYVGNMIRELFLTGHPILDIKGKKGFEFIKVLIDDMVQDDPAKRPTMDQVIVRFEGIVRGLSSWKLRSRVVPQDEKLVKGLRQTAVHWTRRLTYIVKGVSPIPRPQS